MREFGQDYLFKITVTPVGGYRSYDKKKKPYYVVAKDKKEAVERLRLKSGWEINKVSLLGYQLSGVLFSGQN